MSQPPYPQQPNQQPPQQYPPQQPYQQQPYQQQPPPQPQPKSKAGAIIVAIVIVVIVIIAIVALSFFVAGNATLKVTVNSTHILFEVDFEIYIDGDLKKTGTLSPIQSKTYTFTVYPGPDCHTYDVFASSTGGGFGGQSDSENVNLCGGETKSVVLAI
ncbi:MAG: hypothetical protein KAR39_02640 [Thermoplasmata archaeon]|nr:hypothetical protein [Thermoplasmata archaeon]